MNGFVLSDIPFMIFRILVAGAIGYTLSIVLKRKETSNNTGFALPIMSMVMALISLCVLYSVPMAIVALPLVLLLNPKEASMIHRVILVMALAGGILCGAGYVFAAILGLLLTVPLLLLYKPEN